MYLQPDIDKRHQGTCQADRLPEALSADYVKIDERTLEDLIGQSAEYSRFLAYYNDKDALSGDWRDFFSSIYHFAGKGETCGHVTFSSEEELEAIIAEKPHLSLLVAFLKLFRIEQDNLNTLTESHLRFYYETMLRFSRRQGSNGTVAVSVKLNKGTSQAFIPKGTEFEAGNDSKGNAIIYRTVDGNTVTDAAISKMVAMSAPGKREEYADHLLSEGIQDDMTCSVTVSVPSLEAGCSMEFDIGRKDLAIEYTGPKGWIPASDVKCNSGKLTFSITGDAPAGYDAKKHGGETGPECPAVRFSLTDPAGLELAAVGFSSYRVYKTAESQDNGTLELAQSYAAVIEQLKKAVSGTLDETVQRMSGKTDSTLKGDLDALSSLSRQISSSYAISSNGNQAAASKCTETKCADIWVTTPMGTVPFSGRVIPLESLGQPADEAFRIAAGISGFKEGCALNLYCRLDQSRCNLAKTIPEDNIHWQWWTGSGWEDVKPSCILRDTTASMTKTGFVMIKLPSEALTAPHGLMPKDTVWISLLYDGSFDAYPGIQCIRTDMIELEYSPDSVGKVTTGAILPAGSIKKPLLSVAGVKKFNQEYDGHQGKADENDSSFLSRVSERLRHKDRMSTLWDYEHMILQEHPGILAVKCIPATSPDGAHCPGAVTVAVLPDCGVIRQDDPLKPRIGAEEKESITRFVKEHTSPFVETAVTNPCYRALKVNCRLVFRKDCDDINRCKTLVAQRLVGYLAPWTQDGNPLQFSTAHNTSRIEYFIEQMDDIVEAVKELTVSSESTEYEGDILPDRADVIFTSVPADEHVILECDNER